MAIGDLHLGDLKLERFSLGQATVDLERDRAEFGDLTGIVLNMRTGNVIAERGKIAKMKREGRAIVCRPVGSERREAVMFDTRTGDVVQNVRLVDWPVEKEEWARVLAQSVGTMLLKLRRCRAG